MFKFIYFLFLDSDIEVVENPADIEDIDHTTQEVKKECGKNFIIIFVILIFLPVF